MIKLKNTVLVIIVLVFTSCQTYNTFYGTTHHKETFDSKSKRLDLSHQNLSAIPEGFSTLKELKMLDLSGNTGIDLQRVLESLRIQKDLKY